MDETLRDQISTILAFNPSDLKREKGDFQFTDIGQEIESLHAFVKDISENESFFSQLPENLQGDFRGKLQRILDVFTAVRDFDPTAVPNPQDIRNNLAQQLRDIYRDIFEYINKLDVFRLKNFEPQADFTNIIKEAKQTLKEARNSRQEIAKILQAAKKTTAKITLYKYLGIFSEISSRHFRIAVGFGIAALLVGAFLTYLIWAISKDISATIVNLPSVQSVIALLVTKLFFLAIVIYLLQQLVRNYMANMHQAVLNNHRENSLKVFDAMIHSTNTQETTDQVLSHLAKSIFESGETGFFPGKDISKEGPDFIQIFKDIGKPK